MPFVDTRGIFGPAGTAYADNRYNDQNDYDTWTDPSVIAVDNGINVATGLPFTRADVGFGSYTSRADANGRAEAARQAAAHGGGLGGLGFIGTVAAIGMAIASDGASVGMFGGEAAVETAVTTDAFSIGEVVTQSVAGGAEVSTGATTMFDEFGNIVTDNQDGTFTVSDPGGNWNISPSEYSTAVEIYNAGSASSKVVLDDIFGTVSKAIKSVGSIFSASRTALDTATRPAPNLTRTAGQMNLGMPLIALVGYFLLRG